MLILTLGCSIDNELRSYDFGPFTIEGPSNWKVRNIQAIDSYVKEITTSNSNTLYFDYGYYSNPLEEEIFPIYDEVTMQILIENGQVKDSLQAANKRAYDEAILNKKEHYEYDTISGFRAKIVKPKKVGEGITGIYFDSLGISSSMNIRLNFYGIDLNEEDQNQVLNAVRTIKFEK